MSEQISESGPMTGIGLSTFSGWAYTAEGGEMCATLELTRKGISPSCGESVFPEIVGSGRWKWAAHVEGHQRLAKLVYVYLSNTADQWPAAQGARRVSWVSDDLRTLAGAVL